MAKTGPKPRLIIERFWEKVNIGKPDECWEWLAYKEPAGYGAFGLSRCTMERAHRVAWCFFFGAIPKGYCVCHHCDNPSCVNPRHLFLGTHKDNALDMMSKGRGVSPPGELNGTSKLSNKDVIEIRSLWKNGTPQREIARIFQVHNTTIHAIVRYKTWRHLP